jgi:predicted enzyme related to lactoylglutathione lyase
MHGEVVHIDLVSSDFNKSKKFYSGIFGWQCTEVNVPGLPYMLWKPPAGPAGGFRRPSAGDEPTPRVINYIRVESIDETVKAIKKNGGEILVPKTEISKEVGFMALFRDPDGNQLGLIEEPKK